MSSSICEERHRWLEGIKIPTAQTRQFFICFADATFLDGQYTVWGQVVEGMEHVDKIQRGVVGSGAVANPDSMIKVTVASDTVLRIDDNASAGGDGTSWAKAFSNLSEALDAGGQRVRAMGCGRRVPFDRLSGSRA